MEGVVNIKVCNNKIRREKGGGKNDNNLRIE